MKRIAQKTAKRYWEKGETIVVVPCNMNPNSPWYSGCRYSKATSEEKDFEKLINAYEYYNCNLETGKYADCYVEE